MFNECGCSELKEKRPLFSESLGESNAVFLCAAGGDVASEPPKTGRAAYSEENFSGPHKDLDAAIAKSARAPERDNVFTILFQHDCLRSKVRST